MKATLIALSLALISLGANAQHNHESHGENHESHGENRESHGENHESHGTQSATRQMEPMFKDKALGTTYSHYIHLKDALVASNEKEAQEASEELATSAKQVSDGNNAAIEATKVAHAGTLADQRKAFASLSNEMITLVKQSALSMGEIYLDYCPMYTDNGGYWLSNEQEIRNPYLADKMPKCGKVKETIK